MDLWCDSDPHQPKRANLKKGRLVTATLEVVMGLTFRLDEKEKRFLANDEEILEKGR